MRNALAIAITAAAVFGCSEYPAEPVPVILISIDTLRADALGAYGFERFPASPVLDAFASENIQFENAFVQEPRTLTSHMSLMTGLYVQNHRVQDEQPLPAEISTLAMRLKERGYATQAYVDDGWLQGRWGFDRGFDGYVDDQKFGLEKNVTAGIEWIEQQRDSLFFLFLHTYDVHTSGGPFPRYAAPGSARGTFSKDSGSVLEVETAEEFGAAWEDRRESLSSQDIEYVRASYAEGVRDVDAQLGRLFAALKKMGLYDRVAIIVWSDHGEALFQHENVWGHGNLYHETIHVPMLIRIPGVRGGRRIRSVVESIDLAPTILALAKYDGELTMDGSVLPPLEAEVDLDYAYTIRVKENERYFSIHDGRFHYFWDATRDRTYLFDLERDPKESHNLYGSGSPEEERMKKHLYEWISDYERVQEESTSVERPVLDETIKKRLRSLGYLQ